MEDQEKTCETCKHFHRHYVRRSGKQFMPLDCGHCSDPRCRDKRVETPACRRYSKGREKKGD